MIEQRDDESISLLIFFFCLFPSSYLFLDGFENDTTEGVKSGRKTRASIAVSRGFYRPARLPQVFDVTSLGLRRSPRFGIRDRSCFRRIEKSLLIFRPPSLKEPLILVADFFQSELRILESPIAESSDQL